MFWKKPQPIVDAAIVAALETRVKALEVASANVGDRLDALEKGLTNMADEFAVLEHKHIRLRGRVYAYKLHKPDPEDDENTAGDPPARTRGEISRDELRRRIYDSGRWSPGKPAKHD